MNSIQKQNRIDKREKFYVVKKFQRTRFPYFLSNDTTNFDLIPSKGNKDLTKIKYSIISVYTLD